MHVGARTTYSPRLHADGLGSFDTPHVLPFILTYSCEGILQFYIKSIENIAFMFWSIVFFIKQQNAILYETDIVMIGIFLFKERVQSEVIRPQRYEIR